MKLAYRYARLTVLSFGFQQAFKPGAGPASATGNGAGAGNEEDRKPFFERVSIFTNKKEVG